MRLTLRTMLAYLDEILEPRDQAEIGSKIEESEFAADLARRIRDVTRRLRLGAPAFARKSTGQAAGMDPNIVAEYLDNAMASDRVADFERVCLESDVYLAEVAACHQVLTLVLGQPADVNAAARERMYRVPELGTTDGLGQSAASVSFAPDVLDQEVVSTMSSPANGAEIHIRHKPEVPDYLREPTGARFSRIVAGLVLAAAMAGVAFLLFGPAQMLNRFTSRSEVSPTESPNPEQPPMLPSETDDSAVSDSSPESEGPDAQQSDRGPFEADHVEIDPDSVAPNIPLLPPESEVGGEEREPVAPPPGTDLGDGAIVPVLPKLGPDLVVAAKEETSAGDVESESGDASENGLERDGTDADTDPNDDPVNLAAPPPDSTELLADAEPGSEQSEAIGDATDVPAETDPLAAEVGIYSNKNLLLRYDATDSAWLPLPPRAPIKAGDRLLALPSFRPTVVLSSTVTIELDEATSIVVLPPDADGTPQIEAVYGRIVAWNVGQAGNRLAVHVEESSQQFEFGGTGSTIALDVYRVHLDGSDPKEVTAPLIVDLYATNGTLRWGQGDEAIEMEAPDHWLWIDGQPQKGQRSDSVPSWIDPDKLSGVYRAASLFILKRLTEESTRPASVGLLEVADPLGDGRRWERRSLAARCLVHVGQFEPSVVALNDPAQKAQWSNHIETLRHAIARGPEVAEQIQTALRQRCPDHEAEILYRMLWGYNSADLEKGADVELVEFLEHDRLDIRVLAYWNLIHITGLGNSQRLQDPKSIKNTIPRRWRKNLEGGRIVPKADDPA